MSKTFTEKVFGVNQNVNRISSKLSGVAYEDASSSAWTSPLFYGGEVFGIPTGAEWRMIQSEVLLFSLIFRFTENVYLGVALAFVYHMIVKTWRAWRGSDALSKTGFIEERFLI